MSNNQSEQKQCEEKGEFIDTGQLPYLNGGICESQDSRKSSVDSSAMATTLNESSMSNLDAKNNWDDKEILKEPSLTKRRISRTTSAPAVPSLHTTEDNSSLDEASINELDRDEIYLKHVFYFHKRPWRVRRCYILILMTSLTYMTIGLNDSAVGALIPQMQEFYNHSEATMSLCFLANFGGYLVSTAISSYLIHHLPLRIVLMIASAIYAAGSLIGAFAPPFATIIVSLLLTGAGGGLLDVAATSVIIHYEDGPLLTITYSFFSVGSMVSPFIVGGLRSSDKAWNLYFWFPVALSLFLMTLQWFVYESYKAPTEQNAKHTTATKRIFAVFSDSTVLTATVLFFLMMGTQDSWSQWLAKYLEASKGLEGSLANMNQACFWAGVTISRLSLGHFINKWGDMKSAVTLTACFAFMMTGFWKVDNHLIYGTIILNIFSGIFVGPLVPLILATSVERVPHSLKQPATSIIICGGLVGSTVMPLSLGQAIHKFSTDIIPAVLIVCAFIILFGFLALFATKLFKRCKEQRDNARFVHDNGSLAGHIGLNRRRFVHPPQMSNA